MSTDKSYPITLQQLLFLRCNVTAVPGHEPTADKAYQGAPENSISVNAVPEVPRVYQVQMRTVANKEMDPAAPYFIDVECMAMFSVEEGMPEAEALKGVTINGHSVCYGAIRETVAWLTGRQPYGPLLLGLSVLKPSVVGQPEQTKSS